ncbi:MAG: hypothetical protein ABI528_02845 [bacterium]
MKSFFLLFLVIFPFVASNSNSQQPPATPEIKFVEITSVETVNNEKEKNTIQYNSLIAVTLKDTSYINTIIKTTGFEHKQIYLAFNGFKFPNYFLKEYNERNNVLYFDFYHQEKNLNMKEFFGSSLSNSINAKIDLVYSGKIISSSGIPVNIQFYEMYRLLLAWLALIIFWVIIIVWVKDKKLIMQKTAAGDEQESLGKFFALMWTGVIASIYLFFYILASQIPEILGSTLVLLGITLGTSVVGSTQKPKKEPLNKLNEEGRGFVYQILNGEDGPSINRFQALVFNIIFLVIFISYAAALWEFYQFNEYQLGLLGIANGAFLGFKFMS